MATIPEAPRRSRPRTGHNPELHNHSDNSSGGRIDARDLINLPALTATMDHGLLLGLADNDHPQYLLAADAVTGYQPLDPDLTQIAAQANVRGDLLVTNSVPEWVRFPVGAATRIIQSDGTDPSYVAISGDATLAAGGALTLASIIAAGGPTGSATVAPIITYDAKGRLTAVSSATITPAVGSITGLAAGVAAWLADPTSAKLATAVTDETGSGALVFGTSPTIVTPTISPTGWTNANHNHNDASRGGQISLTAAVTGILPLVSGGTAANLSATGGANQFVRQNSAGGAFTVSAIAAADLPGAFAGFANPTASVGLSAVNGSAATALRSDGAPALSQAIIPTWTGLHSFTKNIDLLNTTSTTVGVISRGGAAWLHNYTGSEEFPNTNVFLGSGSGNFTNIDPCSYNVGIGAATLAAVTEGAANLAIGGSALGLLTTGSSNVAIGAESCGNLVSGTNNVGLGDNAVRTNSTGSYNIGIGALALRNVTGSNNIGIGANAGKNAAGDYALYINAYPFSTSSEEQRGAIIFGQMSSAGSAAAQTLRLNAAVTISQSINLVCDDDGVVIHNNDAVLFAS